MIIPPTTIPIAVTSYVETPVNCVNLISLTVHFKEGEGRGEATYVEFSWCSGYLSDDGFSEVSKGNHRATGMEAMILLTAPSNDAEDLYLGREVEKKIVEHIIKNGLM